jgi:hypothetical protein
MGADKANIQASLCAAIRIAKEQKSASLEKRAEATYAEYRRQKASGSGGRGFRVRFDNMPAGALVFSTISSAGLFDCVSWIRFCDRSTCSELRGSS